MSLALRPVPDDPSREGNERFGLVVQNLDYDAIGVPILYPDMPGEEFDARWDDLPLASRLAFGLLRPVVTAAMGVFGSRRALAAGLEEDVDLPEPDVGFDLWDSLDDLIVDQRDRLLVDAIRTTHEQRRGDDIDVAVVWGAGHMTAVVHGLWALGYRPDAGEWLTVFRLDEPTSH